MQGGQLFPGLRVADRPPCSMTTSACSSTSIPYNVSGKEGVPGGSVKHQVGFPRVVEGSKRKSSRAE